MTKYILVEYRQQIAESLAPALQELAGMELAGKYDSASEAIAALKLNPDWQVVIVDLYLREGSGLEVLEAVQTRRFKQRALVLTSYKSPELVRKFAELGADAVFDKATQIEDFLNYCVSKFR